MFGRDPFSLFRDDPFFSAFFGGFPGPGMHQPPPYYQQQQQPRLRAPVIEELHDEASGREGGSSDQPIVEEPDDAEDPAHRAHQRPKHSHPNSAAPSARMPGPQHHAQAMPSMPGLFGSLLGDLPSGGATYSYSSSSYSSSGPGGVTYQSTYSSRQGPGGVREVQSTVRDGRTGQHSMTISRGLGDKEHTISRTKDATGQESHHTAVQGIAEHEVDRFQQEWMQQAATSLQDPFSPHGRLQHSASRTRAANNLALPAAPTQTFPVYGSQRVQPQQPMAHGSQQQNGYGTQQTGYGSQQVRRQAH